LRYVVSKERLMHSRFFGIVRASSSSNSTRCFSTSEEQSKNSLSSVEPIIEKESAIQVKENAEATQEFQAKLSDFAETPQTFVSLNRISKFVNLGEVATGEIYHMVGDDVYIDFGSKFQSIRNLSRMDNVLYYVRGSKVRLRIKKEADYTKLIAIISRFV
ncbi:RT28 protein, partial [Acromyrmex insinuator]